MRRARFGSSEPLSEEALIAYNTMLAKRLQGLKKDAGATRIAQNYRGTGRQAFRRQLWVRFKSGAVIDLWLEGTRLGLGGVVKNPPPGSRIDEAVILPRSIPYSGRTPEEVYVEAATALRAWANPGASYSRRSRRR